VTGRLRLALPAPAPLEDEDEDAALMRDFVPRAFGPAEQLLGSGFVIDEAGYILTNAHVVAEGEELVVGFADRREFPARVVGFDPVTDIALLKIDAGGLQPARIGDPARLRPGEWVAAIGSPFGLERSITAGIVSAVARTLRDESFVSFIQTDVAVNPGNSGGPLFNLRGEVVGVTSAIYTETGGYMGLSFAVPIDIAMEVAAQLRAQGRVTRGRIGVRLQEITAELARALGLPRGTGALVVEVFRRSPAERAALRPGDVIVRFDGKPVGSDADLVRLTAAAKPGETVEVEIVRFGASVLARIKVVAGQTPMPPAVAPAGDPPLGLQLVPLERSRRGRPGIDKGLLVERARDASERAGLLRGDIILSVNGRETSSPEAFHDVLRAAGRGATVALLVQRDGYRQFVPLRVPR
jgi:serine protease Do